MEHAWEDVVDRVRSFAVERDWEQFHTPKNLALALAGEVGELCAELQWLSNEQVSAQAGDELRNRLSGEAADVLLYLIRLTDVCGIDLLAAASAKLDSNEERYPADQSRGRSTKYDQLARERDAQ